MQTSIELRWVSGGGGIPLDDRMLTHGLGVFETLLAVDGHLVRLDFHFERMAASCATLGMTAPDWPVVLAEIEEKLPCAGRHRVRVARSAGAGRLDQIAGDKPLTLIAISPLPPAAESVRVITAPWSRNESSPLAAVKCSSYAESLLALDHARRAGAAEAIFLNSRGRVAEAATANVFIVQGDRFLTPPLTDGCLAGTLRRWIFDRFPHQAVERSFTLDEALAADGIFLTSAIRGPMAVSDWDGRKIRNTAAMTTLRAAWERSLGRGP